MVISINSSKNCCGCTACASVCSANAVTLEADSLGFFYPSLNVEKCVNCGRCISVCPFNAKVDPNGNPIAYASRHKDLKQVQTSRSGASFIALSDYIIKRGGVVYGVGFDNNYRVIHKRAVSLLELQEFKGSKYSQSDMRGILKMVLADLQQNMTVCFSGTPCQVSAVKRYVPTKYHKNLYLIDIVCHSVASPAIWQDHIKYIEKRFRGKVEKVNFRDKQLFGWKDHRESYIINDKTITFRHSYYHPIHYRPSCSNCKFTNLNRPSDITIADFWGVERVAPEFNQDNNGCNLILVNSEKGVEWLNAISDTVILKEVNINDCLQYNLQFPTAQHNQHENFQLDYEQKGFLYVMKKYCGWGCINLVHRLFKKLIHILHINH